MRSRNTKSPTDASESPKTTRTLKVGEEVKIGAWAGIIDEDGKFHYFHDHKLSTGGGRILWDWSKADGVCTACGETMPKQFFTLIELQRLSFVSDKEDINWEI